MSNRGKIRLWCPQPTQKSLPISFAKSPAILAALTFVEIIALLIAPMAYYALLAPKTSYSVNQTFFLTNGQIKAAWPNLPTAQELVNSGMTPIGGLAYSGEENCSVVNPFFINGGFNASWLQFTLTNPEYKIFLYYNSSTGAQGWIEVPSSDLTTSHPPQIPSAESGVLGTGLPMWYITLALAAVIVTVLVGILVIHRKTCLARDKEC